MRKVFFLTVAVTGAASSAYGQGSDPRNLLQQKLKDQFSLTRVTADGSGITSAGTVVALRKGGLWTYSTASCVPYLNTYNKKGNISQPFGANLRAGVACGLRSNNTKYPQRLFMAGDKFSIIGLFFQNDGITFRLYSDPYDGIRYYGDLKFPFEKGSIPDADEALGRIGEVLQSGASTQGAEKPDSSPTTPPPVAPPPVPLHLPATYVSAQTPTDQLRLNADNTFSLQEAGQSYQGAFVANGNTVELNIRGGSKTTATIQGNNLIDSSGQTWALQEQTGQATQQPPVNPPAATPLVPLQLPCTYVSAQTPADQLQLNADNSFSLQEAGQTYHGTFATSGSTLELRIKETNIATTAAIQGNNLTDSSGQTWVLREKSAGAVPTGALLRNEDIIKLAKAGLGDAVIIAKIRRSNCQFDISVNALVELKKGGVSGTVLNAMVEAGK
jgi:hypothetical protein